MAKFTFKFFFLPAVALGLTMLVMNFIFGVEVLPKGSVEEMQSFIKSGEAVSSAEQSASIGGDFTLTNQHGEVVSNEDFKGKLMLVYFGFANCPDVCPTDLANISAAMEMLDATEQEQIVPIFITVDPERDTQEALAQYMSNFYAGFQALTGSSEDAQAAAKAYRVYAKKVEMAGMDGYMMEHSAYIYLMDGEGKYIRHFRHNDSPEVLVEGVKSAM